MLAKILVSLLILTSLTLAAVISSLNNLDGPGGGSEMETGRNTGGDTERDIENETKYSGNLETATFSMG
jgi:hypothetical protein